MDQLDKFLLNWVYAGARGGLWVHVLAFISFLGSGWMLWLLSPVFVLPSLHHYRRDAKTLLGAVVSTAAIVCAVKWLTERLRPCHALAWERIPGVRLPNDFSFPSGHAAGAFTVATFVFVVNRRFGILLFAIAALVAFSRVALGMHYPSDVTVGALLGTGVGWLWGRPLRTGDGTRPAPRHGS